MPVSPFKERGITALIMKDINIRVRSNRCRQVPINGSLVVVSTGCVEMIVSVGYLELLIKPGRQLGSC